MLPAANAAADGRVTPSASAAAVPARLPGAVAAAPPHRQGAPEPVRPDDLSRPARLCSSSPMASGYRSRWSRVSGRARKTRCAVRTDDPRCPGTGAPAPPLQGA